MAGGAPSDGGRGNRITTIFRSTLYSCKRCFSRTREDRLRIVFPRELDVILDTLIEYQSLLRSVLSWLGCVRLRNGTFLRPAAKVALASSPNFSMSNSMPFGVNPNSVEPVHCCCMLLCSALLVFRVPGFHGVQSSNVFLEPVKVPRVIRCPV